MINKCVKKMFVYDRPLIWKIIIISLSILLLPNPSFSNEVENNKDSEGKALIAVAQSSIRISGRVVDKDGFPIPGVAINVKGKPEIGTVTEQDGKYAITCNPDDMLVFSFMGFKTMEQAANEIDKVTLTMEEDALEMDEVVVVAFGKQKKESVVSSITTISPQDLRIPSSNLTTAFAGQIAGVIAYQRSGEPGLDDAEYFIRGITTFSSEGKKDPLILIDGIEMESTDLARINPDDIASFSVLKDASSAALYGARGANGVILVTTKEGVSEKLNINIRAELSTSANSELVELADPITYMRLHNEAVRTRDPLTMRPYSSEKIYNTQLGNDPINYPSVDWYNYLLKKRTFNQRVNANISGGGKAVQYYIAAGLQHDTGIFKESKENQIDNNIDVLRFQLRTNVTIKITPRTTARVRAYGSFDDSQGPKDGGKDAFNKVRNATPVQFLPAYPKDTANEFTEWILFGMAGDGVYSNPYAQIISSYKEEKKSMMFSQLELEHSFDGPLKGLFVQGIYNIKRNSEYDLNRSYRPFYYTPVATADGSYLLYCYNPDTGTNYLDYNFGNRRISSSMYGEFRIGYNKVFNEKHDLNLLLLGAIRSETDTKVTTLQESLPKRNINSAGRVTYGYDSRYFIEANFGYNGSERFSKSKRFGFFPSIGAGWMVSNEVFMEGLKKVIPRLKLKATYGLVGNDAIGDKKDRFFFQSQIEMNNSGMGYVFGTERGYAKSGILIKRYANDQISWEIAKKTNFGIELTLFNDLEILADYFMEKRENILQTRTDIPTTMGLVTIPQANVGIAKGSGFEAEVKYRKHFNPDVFLIINGNFTYASSKYKEFEEPDHTDAPWKSHIGKKLSQQYGYIAERLFIDEAEVANAPVQTFGSYGAGDIKYKDINNDGQINSDDMVPIGYPTTPEIIYGAGFSMGFHGFDLSCFFQGSARSSFFIEPDKITPFINNGQRGLLQYIADDHWSETNRNLYAFWPRLSEYEIKNNSQKSTWWLQDGIFLRLKNAEFGYTLPEKISQKIGMKMLRVYLSGSNLLVWSKFKMWDPEMAGNGLGYPVQRVFNLGVNINF
ncbi:MAG: TonB-dependent receptor [Bacteroidales bacterium]|jgi:TonB-linked SusC/RagA family outer membrane protein|nr:TonB-dependent receptor [Bacteroidales bacterium]